jgi:hypothetical protein
MKTKCCHSDQIKPFIRDKSDKNYRNVWTFVTNNVFFVVIFISCCYFETVLGQQNLYPYPPNWERDPRFYSREGVNYNPPNPGDENYR